MRRVISVLVFAFRPLRKTSDVLGWWQPAAFVLATASAIVGIALPKQPGGLWLALAGVAGIGALFFLAAYRLHVLAFPEFPRHKLDLGRPWIVENPDAHALIGEEKLLIFDFAFYNREPQRRVNLTVDVVWSRVVGKQSLGPYMLSHHRGPLGRLELFPRKSDVGPERHVEGTAVFSALVPGVTLGEEGSDFEAPKHLAFSVRLTDNISGAEHLEPLRVRRAD